jgi:hypothetical protein
MKLNDREYRIARAVCSTDNAPLSQKEIAASIGVNQCTLSSTIKTLCQIMGLIDADERSHVSRTRMVIAAHKAGGFDQLATLMGISLPVVAR